MVYAHKYKTMEQVAPVARERERASGREKATS